MAGLSFMQRRPSGIYEFRRRLLDRHHLEPTREPSEEDAKANRGKGMRDRNGNVLH